MITITERAGEALKAAVAGTEGKATGVRIAIDQPGQPDSGYSIGLVSDGLSEDRKIVAPLGITVFISEQAAPTLSGAVLDYGETDVGPAFSIFNPNAVTGFADAPSQGCGCGKSSCGSN